MAPVAAAVSPTAAQTAKTPVRRHRPAVPTAGRAAAGDARDDAGEGTAGL